MKISCEIPVSILKSIYSKMDFPFIIAHYKEIPEYKEFYQKACKESDYSILDNGAFELGKPVSDDDLLDAIETFKPTYVIAPEVYRDAKGTIEEVKRFKEVLRKNSFKTKIAGVVQGSSLHLASYCLTQLHQIVDLITIPFVFPYEKDILELNPILGRIEDKTLRRALVRVFVVDYFGLTTKPIHLLGMNCPLELKMLSNKKNIISTDSSSAIQHGLVGVKYTPEGLIPGGKIDQEHDYITKSCIENFEINKESIEYNIDFLKRV